jgi:hypothetical protein
VANGTLKNSVDVSTATKSGNDYTVGSGNITVTSAGYYCFTATWAGDTNYKPVSPATVFQDDGTNECLQITPVSPALHTQVSNAGPSSPGTTIHDTVTFDTAPATPSNGTFGTITFSVYGPFQTSTATCTGTPTTSTATVQAGVTSYNSSDFSPTAPGYYFWTASYAPGTGDVNNTSITASCGEANEAYQVQKLQPSIDTAQKYVLHDEVTITVASSSAGALAGHVRFRLYNNATCSTTSPNALLYDSDTPHPGGIAVTVAANGLTATASSDNVNVNATASHLSWLVQYTSTNTGHFGVQSSCDVENSAVTINNGTTQTTTFP